MPAVLQKRSKAENHELSADLAADGFLTIREAAAFLHLCVATIYNLCEDGSLPYAKFGRARRIPLAALKQYVQRSMVQR